MLGIGEFARRGRISVRMLRHYDAMGLLTPAHVDEWTGRRAYEVSQLARLNRLVVLKELGFSLQQVKTMLDELDPVELHGMLRLRRMELEAQIDADVARLAEVEARLRAVDDASGGHDLDVTVRPVEPLRVALRSGVAASYDPASITPVVQPLFDEIIAYAPSGRHSSGTNGVSEAGSSSTSASRWTPSSDLAAVSPSSTCRGSSVRRSRCITVRPRASWRPSRRWPRGSTVRPTGRREATARSTSTAPARATGGSWRSRNPCFPGRPRPGDHRHHSGGPDARRRHLPRGSALLGRDAPTRPGRGHALLRRRLRVGDARRRRGDPDVRRRDPARAGGSRYRECGGGGLGRRRRLVHPGPRRRPTSSARSTPAPLDTSRSSPIRSAPGWVSGRRPPGREPRS